MGRTVKHPEERKRELLATAMRLFAEEGYDNVTVRSIARATHVTPGLAYHYFDSKQALFSAAIADYSRRCAEDICAVLDDCALTLDEQLDRCIDLGTANEGFEHASYFHAEGNGTLHDRLSLGMCETIRPHLQAALERDASRRGASGEDAGTLAAMMLYSCVGLVSGPEATDKETITAAKRYLHVLIDAFRHAPAQG